MLQSARDCLELFLAVVPSKFSSVIETVPRMGAVFYNDCVYISHSCTLMTHLYRQVAYFLLPIMHISFLTYCV